MARFQAKFTVACIASGALSAAALAQTPPTQTPPPAPTAEQQTPAPPAPPAAQTPAPSAAQTVDVGNQEIRSFAMAIVEVDKIQKKYQPQLETAPAEQRPALEQEANAKMTAAVEAQGLDPQTFNAISAAAQDNPELRDKIRAEVAKVQPAPAGQ